MVRILTFVLVITLVIGLSNFAYATARTEASRIVSDSMSQIDKVMIQFDGFVAGNVRLGTVLTTLESVKAEVYRNMVKIRNIEPDSSIDEETLIKATVFVTGLYMMTDFMHLAIGKLDIEMLQACTGMLLYLKYFAEEHHLKSLVRW